MLHHCANCKFLASLACLLFNLKSHSVSEGSKCEHAQKHLRLGQSSSHCCSHVSILFASRYEAFIYESPLVFTPVGVLSMCQVQGAAHRKL